MACVARDHNGMFVSAITHCREGLLDPELTEAFGIHEALSWIRRQQWPSIILESDSLLCVQALRSQVQLPSYFGSLITACIETRKTLPNTIFFCLSNVPLTKLLTHQLELLVFLLNVFLRQVFCLLLLFHSWFKIWNKMRIFSKKILDLLTSIKIPIPFLSDHL